MANHQNQHAEISEFHARLFYAEGAKSFFGYDLVEARWFDTHAGKVGVRRNYFDVPGEDGKKFEIWMGTVETAAQQAIARVLQKIAVSPQEILNIAQYAMLLRARSPAFEVGMTSLGVDDPISDDPNLRRMFYTVGPSDEILGIRRDVRVPMQVDVFRTWTDLNLRIKRYTVLFAERDILIVGDSAPISLVIEDSDVDVVALALTPRVLLEFHWSDGDCRRGELTEAKAAICNSVALMSASRYIYAAHRHAIFTSDGKTLVELKEGTDPRRQVAFLKFAHGDPGTGRGEPLALRNGLAPHQQPSRLAAVEEEARPPRAAGDDVDSSEKSTGTNSRR